MATNKTLLLVLLAGVFLVSGCTAIAPGPGVSDSNFGFLEGSEALTLSFLEGQPPAAMPEQQLFSIAVNLENVGEKEISSANVVIEGLGNNYNLEPGITQPIGLLEGRQKIVSPEGGSSLISGGQEIVVFNAKTPPVEVTIKDTATIRATVLYPYETTAVSTICVKQNILEQTIGGQEICKSTGIKSVTTSAGPIKVTSVEQTVGNVIITIKNVGSGNPFVNIEDGEAPYEANLPGDVKSFSELNYLDLSTANLDIEGAIDCSNTNKIRLNPDGTAQFSCRTNFRDNPNIIGESKQPLVLHFKYGYKQSETTKLTVTEVPGLTITPVDTTTTVDQPLELMKYKVN